MLCHYSGLYQKGVDTVGVIFQNRTTTFPDKYSVIAGILSAVPLCQIDQTEGYFFFYGKSVYIQAVTNSIGMDIAGCYNPGIGRMAPRGKFQIIQTTLFGIGFDYD